MGVFGLYDTSAQQNILLEGSCSENPAMCIQIYYFKEIYTYVCCCFL